MKSRWTLVCTLCLAVAGASTVLAGDGPGATKQSPTPAQPPPAQTKASQSSSSSSTMMSHSGMSSSNMSNSNMMSHSGMSSSNMMSNSSSSKPGSASETMGHAGMGHMSMHLTKDEVKSIQTALRQAGNDPGTVDGVMGKKTSAALRTYQKEHDLKVTGKADDETCARLGVKLGAHASS